MPVCRKGFHDVTPGSMLEISIPNTKSGTALIGEWWSKSGGVKKVLFSADLRGKTKKLLLNDGSKRYKFTLYATFNSTENFKVTASIAGGGVSKPKTKTCTFKGKAGGTAGTEFYCNVG